MAPSSPPSEFRLQRTVPKVPTAEPSSRRPASGRIGAYELLEEIGRGGMGVVYLARSPQGEQVALKVMREASELSPGLAERFRREAEIAAPIRHPNIVGIRELGEHGGHPFLVMDFVPGGTLNEHLKRFLADHSLAVRTLVKVALAVHHAHQLGILHRDLKPGNVLLDAQDEPKVTDFGLAKLPGAAPDLSRDGELIGTPAYMAPEQAAARNDQVGPATDVWGLGVILYELLTGLRPFPGGDQSRMLFAIRTARPLPPRLIRPLLDPALEAIVLRCLENEPSRRYGSALALAEDLDRWQRGELLPPTGSSPLRSGKRIGSVAVCLLGISLLLVGLPGRKASPPTLDASQTIQAKWLRGEKVELLRDGQLPARHRWPLRPSQTLGFQPLALDSYAPCLLEVVPEIPATRYRLRVETLACNLDLGGSGVYFAHQQQDRGGESHHLFGVLLCSQTDRDSRLTLEVHRHRETGRPASGDFGSTRLWNYPLPRPSSPVANWHELGVEVSPEEVTVFWEGDRVGQIVWGRAVQAAQNLASEQPPLSSAVPLSPSHAAGVYVRRGSAAFRNLILEPAP